MAKRKKEVEERSLRVRSLIGKKLENAGNTEDGWSILYFSNGMKLKVKGDVLLVVEEDDRKKVK